MEKKAVIVHSRRGRTAQPISIQSPQENPNVWNVIFSFAAFDVPDVNSMRSRFESAAKSLERLPLAQIGRVEIRWSNVIHELRPRQQLEKLNRARVPTRDIARELLEHGGGTFAAAIADGVRHFGARRALVGPDWVPGAITDQVADVRQAPWRAVSSTLI